MNGYEIRGDKIRRILIVHTDEGLGELLLATPVFRAIRQSFPNVYLAVATRSEYAEVVRGNVYVNEVIPLIQHWRDWSPRNLSTIIKFLLRKYDLAIVLNIFSNSWSSELLAYLRGRFVLGSEQAAVWKFLYDALAPYSGNQRHYTEQYLDVVRRFDIDTEDLKENITLNKDEKEWAAEFLAEHGMNSNDLVIALHIDSDSFADSWGVRKFVQVAKYLAAHHNAKIMVSWSDEEEYLGWEFINSLPFPVLELSGLPIREYAAVIYYADAMVCSDCAVMHLAAAVGAPFVAFFNFNSPQLHKPIGAEFIALNESVERPASVGVDTVIETILGLVENHPKRLRLEADSFDISDEVLNDYLDILNISDE